MSLVLASASSQYLTASAAPITGYASTFAVNFKCAQTNAENMIFDVCNSTSAIINALRMRCASTGLIRNTVGNGTTTSAASTSTSYSAGVWGRATNVMNNATSRQVRLDNAGIGTDSANLTPSGIDAFFIGAANLNGVISQHFNGELAELCVWNIALPATQLAMYQAGVNPLQIAKDNLIIYCPFADAVQGYTNLAGPITITPHNSPTFASYTGVRAPYT